MNWSVAVFINHKSLMRQFHGERAEAEARSFFAFVVANTSHDVGLYNDDASAGKPVACTWERVTA